MGPVRTAETSHGVAVGPAIGGSPGRHVTSRHRVFVPSITGIWPSKLTGGNRFGTFSELPRTGRVSGVGMVRRRLVGWLVLAIFLLRGGDGPYSAVSDRP